MNVLYKRIVLILSFLLITLLNFSAQEIELIENKGQWNDNIVFRTAVSGGYMYVEDNSFTFDFMSIKEQIQISKAHVGKGKYPETLHYHAYKINFLGSSTNPIIEGRNKSETYYNFFLGNDSTKWGRHANAFSAVYYEGIYSNIDLDLYSEESFVKYDWIIHPGGDPTSIELAYEGLEKMKVKNGRLFLYTSVNEIIEERPYAYQWINGTKKEVACRYELVENILRFVLEDDYDRSKVLVIDPVLKFSTYSGSFANNFGYTATYDRLGFLYSGSSVFGNGYPTTTGAYDISFNTGNVDIAISKYDTTGTFMVYSTYLGGIGDELPHSIVVNDLDELFVFGTTSSVNYPIISGSFQTSFAGGGDAGLPGLGVGFENGTDIIISRFNSDGDNLLGSTYVGGSGNDGLNLASGTTFNYADEIRGEIDLDEEGNVFIATCTSSNNFPVTDGAYQTTYNGNQDGVVCKFTGDLANMIWGSYYGGSSADAVYSLAIDSEDQVVICGGTNSSNLNMPSNALSTNFNGGDADAFVVKYSEDGASILAGTYIGTSTYDQSYFVELDNQDNVHLYGQSTSGDELIFNAGYNGGNSGQFISKLNPEMSNYIWSTTFGTGDGFPDISPTAFLVDLCNRIYLSGWGGPVQSSTSSTTGLPITADAYQSTTDGGDFYLFVIEEDASSLVYASFYGGNQSNEHVDGGTSRFDRKGKIYQSVCAGCQDNSDFPIFPSDAVSSTNNSGGCNNAVFKFDFELPGIVSDFTYDPVCLPDPIQFDNISQGGLTFNWDFGDNTTSTEINPSHVYDEPGVYEVTLIISDPMSCNFSDTTTQNVFILQEADFELEDYSICNGENIQLGFDPIPSPGYTYSWSPSSLVSNPNISNPTTSITENTTFTLTVSNGVCESTSTQNVSVVNFIAEFPEDVVSCENGLAQTLAMQEYPTPSTFIWSESPNLSDPINSIPSQDEINVNPESTTTYYIQLTHQGCEIEEQVTVFVEAFEIGLPDITEVCENETIQISATDPSPSPSVSFVWQDNVSIISGQNTATVNVSATENTNLYVTGTSEHGCSFMDSTLVHINIIALEMPDDITICDGENINLIANTLGTGDSFIWSDQPGFGNVLSNDSTVIVSPTSSTTYYFQAQNFCEINGQVEVNIASELYSISPDIFLCSGDDLSLSVQTSAPGQTFTVDWFPDSQIISGDGTSTVNVNTDDSQIFVANITTSEGCEFSQSVNVEVSDLSNITVDATADETVIPQGGSTVLHAEPASGYSVVWTPAEPLSSSTSTDPTATIFDTTTFGLTITDNNANGFCQRGDTITISVFEFDCNAPTIFVPNAFSPNNDGHNDSLYVRSDYISTMELSIYNRWGELVFKTEDQDEGWSGFYEGKLSSPAVYVYHLNLTCINKQQGLLKGNITLLR